MKKSTEIVASYFPEVMTSGFTSIDGTIEFYTRVNSLLLPSMTVLDFGAGRGSWREDDACKYRSELMTIRGKVEKIIGCDVDKAILENQSLDEKLVINIGDPLPFENESIDVIISDWTFEHIANPFEVAKEFYRILKKGGWVCARTPNKYAYSSLFTRIIRNSSHARLLRFVQPERKEIDVFPTTFRINSLKEIAKYFKKDYFDNYTYRFEAEPAYYFNKKLIFKLMLTINKYLPRIFKSTLLIFLRKK